MEASRIKFGVALRQSYVIRDRRTPLETQTLPLALSQELFAENYAAGDGCSGMILTSHLPELLYACCHAWVALYVFDCCGKDV
jgi:hypothetical protein